MYTYILYCFLHGFLHLVDQALRLALHVQMFEQRRADNAYQRKLL